MMLKYIQMESQTILPNIPHQLTIKFASLHFQTRAIPPVIFQTRTIPLPSIFLIKYILYMYNICYSFFKVKLNVLFL